jgi:hypothetical protein
MREHENRKQGIAKKKREKRKKEIKIGEIHKNDSRANERKRQRDGNKSIKERKIKVTIQQTGKRRALKVETIGASAKSGLQKAI